MKKVARIKTIPMFFVVLTGLALPFIPGCPLNNSAQAMQQTAAPVAPVHATLAL